MLRIAPGFVVENPRTLEDALDLLGRYGAEARVLAGGTDFLPNLKHGLYAPAVLVSLKRIGGLDAVHIGADEIALGALVSLHTVSTHAALRAALPSLAAAAAQVAGPQHRRMGTLGGNLCLDTRCVYVNQTPFWRGALGYCLKKDGAQCHVVPAGKKCVAAASNDTAPPLLTLGARVDLASPRGRREVDLDAFYVNDGVKNTVVEPDEILTAVKLPRPAPTRRMAFQKLRVRGAIDFPLLNLALSFDLDAAGQVRDPTLVISAVASKPKRIKRLPEGPLEPELVAAIGERAFQAVRPLTNINGDTAWRRAMIPVLVERAFAAAIGEGDSGSVSYICAS